MPTLADSARRALVLFNALRCRITAVALVEQLSKEARLRDFASAPPLPAAGDDRNILELRLSDVEEPSTIRIRLRPDLSGPLSVDHVKALCSLGASADGRRAFYRAEAWGVLQGEMAHAGLPEPSQKGPCPAGVDPSLFRPPIRKCFDHDPGCGCHGPIFEPGMVGWAGGLGGGPDFFVWAGAEPASWWSHDHTVWGELADAASWAAVARALQLPTHGGDMAMLDTKVPFTMALVDEGGAASGAEGGDEPEF